MSLPQLLIRHKSAIVKTRAGMQIAIAALVLLGEMGKTCPPYLIKTDMMTE
ncbi:MAG: hypothetical protein SAL07_03090 [Oscillatoria sp. PMC 1051.18]|nr:hypothetical protein [Oscillatoria sp. PMC 1050.18]MEC5028874.1 hypothetical protein [Oscillatoria sp. PMC 1051.18]